MMTALSLNDIGMAPLNRLLRLGLSRHDERSYWMSNCGG